MNIILVMHQPRYSIFQMMDTITLLGSGGYCMYAAPASSCVNYFSQLGYVIPANDNPADILLDIVTNHANHHEKEIATETRIQEFLEQGRRAVNKIILNIDRKHGDGVQACSSIYEIVCLFCLLLIFRRF
jgi:hypothetical protein